MQEAFGAEAGAYRRPLVLLSYSAQSRLGLAAARDLHAANALLHAANAALVVMVFVAVGGTVTTALATAVVFAFHPVASGSVAYISGRTDLLATMFTLIAVWLATPPGATRARSRTFGLLACVAVAAAAMSKESGLMAGPLVAALLWWRRAAGERTITGLHLIAAPLVSILTAALVLPAAAAATVPAVSRIRGVGTVLATFAGLVVWPAELHLDRLTPLGGGWASALGAVAILAGGLAIVAFARRPSRTGLLAVAFVLLYAPGSGLMPVYPNIADRLVFTGEQFLYAPIMVIAAAAALAVERLAAVGMSGDPSARLDDRPVRIPGVERASAYRTFVPIAVALLAALAWTPVVLARQQEFSSAERVYRTTLAHSASPRACFNLGNTLLARRDFAEAVSTYESCVAMAPGDAGAYGQLAIALQQLGRRDEARRAYERSTILDDRNARVWSNFATLDANSGRFDEARRKWERALAVDPNEQTARAALDRLDAASR